MKDTITLARELIRFKTIKDNPEELQRCISFVGSYLKHPNLIIKRFERNQKPSLVVTFEDTKSPEVFFCGHLDVVPALNEEQYEAKIDANFLYGRGSADMKTACAAFMNLFRKLAEQNEKPSIGLMLVTDEEIGGKDGCKYLLEEGYSCKFFISGELSDMKIGYEAKGLLLLKIKTNGKGAHSAKPWEGNSAIDLMRTSLSKIEELFEAPQKEEYQNTMIITEINGGEALNSVPAECTATLNIRFVPEEKPEIIIENIKLICPEIEVVLNEPSSQCSMENKYTKILSQLSGRGFIQTPEASDARYFSNKGIPAIIFGLIGKEMHGSEEAVNIPSLLEYEKIIYDFTKNNTYL